MINAEEYAFSHDKDFWYAKNDRVFTIHLDFHDKIALSQFMQVLNDRDNIIPSFHRQRESMYLFNLSSDDGRISFKNIRNSDVEDMVRKLKNCHRYYVITTFSETNLRTNYLEDMILTFESLYIDGEEYLCGIDYPLPLPNR